MLADILHKVAEFEQEDYHYSPRPSLSGPQRCIRSLDYYAQGYERKPMAGRAITVFDDSSWHEELIKGWIRKSAFQVHSEQLHLNVDSGLSFLPERICGARVSGQECGEIIPAGCMAGHIDGCLTDILSVDRLLEIKALSHFGFMEIWGKAELPLDYISQTLIYLRSIKKLNPDINEAILLIKNKNQAQYLELLLQYDPLSDTGGVVNMILSTGEKKEINEPIEDVTVSCFKRFSEIELYRNEKRLHDRCYENNSWRCEYCGWYETCWEQWVAEIEALAEDVLLPLEVADTCRFYRELGARLKEDEKEKDKVGDQIRSVLKEYEARTARAGEYIITNNLQSRTTIDKEKIPLAILKLAEKKTTFEMLRISLKEGVKR